MGHEHVVEAMRHGHVLGGYETETIRQDQVVEVMRHNRPCSEGCTTHLLNCVCVCMCMCVCAQISMTDALKQYGEAMDAVELVREGHGT